MRVRALVVLPVLSLLSACTGGASARSPEDAFQDLARAVQAGDAAAFFRCMTRATRAHIEGTMKAERLQRTIIAGKFPEAEKPAALAKLEAAAVDDPLDYFVSLNRKEKMVEAYRTRLGPLSGPITTRPDKSAPGGRPGDAVWVSRKDGLPLHFRRDGGAWAFDELEKQWALDQEHAEHAVKTVRENAALYLKAAGQ